MSLVASCASLEACLEVGGLVLPRMPINFYDCFSSLEYSHFIPKVDKITENEAFEQQNVDIGGVSSWQYS